MTKAVTNFAASARARLLAVAQIRNADFQLTLQRYAAERFLYRLGVSSHRERFILKGAMLFVLWDDKALRPTKDLDLAGYWENDAASLEIAFREICAIPYPLDGLEFALDTIELTPIRDTAQEHGFRINLLVLLAGARIPFQVDVGFGDAIVPQPIIVDYPVLLDSEAPRVFAYPREAVIAEKFHAMVSLGEVNSRFKDFFDIYSFASRFEYSGTILTAAISATFSNRKSASLSTWPVALTARFYSDAERGGHWSHYLKRTKLVDAPNDFVLVGEAVRNFLEEPVRAVSNGESFEKAWPIRGPWR